MSEDKAQVVLNSHQARLKAARWCMQAGQGVVVEFRRPTRSVLQNARLWSMLTDLSEQVDWYGQKLTPEEWKSVCSASMNRVKVVPGIEGGFVALGMRTSKMSKAQFADLMTLIEAFGLQKGVAFKVFSHEDGYDGGEEGRD